MYEGREFVRREILMYAALILTMYEMRPPEGKQWTIPRTRRQASMKHPNKKVRLWIRRTELPVDGE